MILITIDFFLIVFIWLRIQIQLRENEEGVLAYYICLATS